MANTKEKIELRKHFEANMLNGDSVYDYGKAMISAESVYEYLFESGLIFKFDVLEYVEVCNMCGGYKKIFKGVWKSCPICQGRGIVLKGE